ncbi:hypothetical protein [Sagittula sp. SSi028]|uniref:hypothetical protein n=1 Tax=Sagittula sp. SSi028 TaxID=3400636 RepID=UPI003AF7C785
MAQPDLFFDLIDDTEWNACIGRQGDEENYADGYIEAAIELAAAVLEKRMYEKRDTLVLPILYNGRHAIELTLKLVIGELVRANIVSDGHPKNHDIASHLAFLESKVMPDELFRERLSALRPYVDSLAQIDDDGQELRFHENRDGQRSMEGKALANIAVIRESLGKLQEVLKNLKNRSYSLCDEWRTGTRTTQCSRRDLSEIAVMLPKRENWASAEFDECKRRIKKRFGLGNRQFSIALDKIQETRGLSGLLGIETDLTHLSDAKADWLLKQWDKLHPPRKKADDLGTEYFKLDRAAMLQSMRDEAKVHEAIVCGLTEDEFADAETVYYMARDGVFPEFYEPRLEGKKRVFGARNDFGQEVRDLMSKTNFRRHFVEGLRGVGRINFAGGTLLDEAL